AEECSKSLFGKLIGNKKAHLAAIKRTIGVIWQIKGAVTVKELSPNYFQFLFSDIDDKSKVSKGVSWNFENHPLILKEWVEDISAEHEIFTELDSWIQVWNIPVNWISTDVGLKIGKAFSQVKNVIIPQGGPLAGKCIRLLVTIDIKQPLLRCANIQLGNKRILVDFKYERLPTVYYYCGIIGHTDKASHDNPPPSAHSYWQVPSETANNGPSPSPSPFIEATKSSPLVITNKSPQPATNEPSATPQPPSHQPSSSHQTPKFQSPSKPISDNNPNTTTKLVDNSIQPPSLPLLTSTPHPSNHQKSNQHNISQPSSLTQPDSSPMHLEIISSSSPTTPATPVISPPPNPDFMPTPKTSTNPLPKSPKTWKRISPTSSKQTAKPN
ncbi:Unknown protein, partial [Striga hermonthica]